MVIICFQLTMPNNNSWNGKWTGDGVFYARTRTVAKDKADAILGNDSYHYHFGDGWTASVAVKQVTSADRRKIDRNTKGFYGYEWMIDSIIQHGDIYAKPPATLTA